MATHKLSVSDLVSYWFQKETEKKWFNSNMVTDQIIIDNYGHLLKDKSHVPTTSIECLGWILVYDQVSRHHDRVNPHPEDLCAHMFSSRAVTLTRLFLERYDDWFLNLLPAQQCFVLLPLRHTRKLALVQESVSEIQKLIATCNEIPLSKIPSIYVRFLKASLECLADLVEPVYYPVEPQNTEIGRGHSSWNSILDKECGYNSCNRNRNNNNNLCIIKMDQLHVDRNYVLSLSGGGDSMVCSHIMKNAGYTFCTVLINYGNRDTCDEEVKFVRWWTTHLQVPLFVLNIDIKRNRAGWFREIYENVTRKMRFKAYRYASQMLYPEDIPRVITGANKDDSLENIIANLCKKRSMNNPIAVKHTHFENGVQIYRPIRNIFKKNIIQYAQHNNIPYLEDSTPEWTFRGRIRDKLVPAMNQFDERLIPGLYELALRIEDTTSKYFALLEAQTKFEQKTVTLRLSKAKPKAPVEVLVVSFVEGNYDISYWEHIFETISRVHGYPMIGHKKITWLLTVGRQSTKAHQVAKNMNLLFISNTEFYVYMRPKNDLCYSINASQGIERT